MKKLFIAVFIFLMGLAFTVPSFALENQFGGSWRARMYSQDNFNGVDDVADDLSQADTRFQLFYTALINDNLKLVTAFEMGDTVWGSAASDAKSYGDIGADGLAVEVKHIYAEFTTGEITATVGTQAATIHRGFVFDDDFSGVTVSNGMVTGLFAKVLEGGANTGDDQSLYMLTASFDLDTVKLTPVLTYIDLDADMSLYFLGLDVDATLGETSLWGTFIYNGGDLGSSVDLSAWLAAVGFDSKMTDMVSIHGQAFYATGQDLNDTDSADFGASTALWYGQCYYWAEIMGLGLIDNRTSNGAPVDGIIANITALNLGVTVAPMDKLTCSLDVWYATLNEETSPGLDEALGTEIDLLVSYELIEGLNLDVVGAYLFAGDSTTGGSANDANPWEVGTQLSLSF